MVINETTRGKDYPPVPFFEIAQYLSERGFAVLRYDGVLNHQSYLAG
jgi:hypothetical protein